MIEKLRCRVTWNLCEHVKEEVWRKYDKLIVLFQHQKVADEPAAPCERLPVRAACSTSQEKNEKRRMWLRSQPWKTEVLVLHFQVPFTQRRYAHIATEGDSKHLTTMLCCCTILYVHTVQLTQPKNTEKRRKPMKTRVAKGMKSLIKSKCLRCLRQSALRTRLKGAPGLTLRSHCFALADRGSWQLVAARGNLANSKAVSTVTGFCCVRWVRSLHLGEFSQP